MSTLKEKFDNINLDSVPEQLRFELEAIQEETKNFTDEDAVEIFTKNFNYIYSLIAKKYPLCLNDYTPPPPTAEEIAAKVKEDFEKDEANRIKKEKLEKANALLNKHKKPAEA